MGFSHHSAGKIFGVASVPRIIRRVKAKLARLTPDQRERCLKENHGDAARLDALMEVSNTRDAGIFAQKYFKTLDHRI